MNKREISAVAQVLSSPENSSLLADEVAELAIVALDNARAGAGLPVAVGDTLTDRERSPQEAARAAFDELEEIRTRTHRLAVVGQITYGPQQTPHTVVLGPFSARGVLDTPEKFTKATQGGTAAREAGQSLAWDIKTGKGQGRFMLAPAFFKPRDAWDFFRGSPPAEVLEQAIIQHVIPRGIGPTCQCGLRTQPVCRFCGQAYDHHCPLHDRQAAVHICRNAA